MARVSICHGIQMEVTLVPTGFVDKSAEELAARVGRCDIRQT